MTESKMPAKRVMFCCESCADNYPEGCGHFDCDDLRVMPNGIWLCDGCFTDCDAYDYGFRDLDEDEEITKPDWLDLPVPPALVPKDLVEPLVEALRCLPVEWLKSGVAADSRSDGLRIEMRIVGTTYEAEITVGDLRATRAALSSWEAGQ